MTAKLMVYGILGDRCKLGVRNFCPLSAKLSSDISMSGFTQGKGEGNRGYSFGVISAEYHATWEGAARPLTVLPSRSEGTPLPDCGTLTTNDCNRILQRGQLR